ncbi:MAG: GNAT family N-acetyltransferase [Spirochaetaceae bacterium]
MILNYKEIEEDIFEELLELRVKVMKESLTKLGRFDEKRARLRLRDSFNPKNCYVITDNNDIQGFFQYSLDSDYIKLDHLYIDLEFQGLGLGKLAMDFIKNIASSKNMAIRLYALKQSPANDFYIKNGFVEIEQEEFDNVYVFNSSSHL